MADNWISLDSDEEIIWEGSPKLQRMVGFKITEYVISNKGIYVKRGLLSRSVKRIEFSKIQNTSFSQGFLAKSFGYGSVSVSTAGGSGAEMILRGVDDPDRVQDIISERSKKKETQEEDDVNAEILKVLRSIDEKLGGIEDKLE